MDTFPNAEHSQVFEQNLAIYHTEKVKALPILGRVITVGNRATNL